MPSKNHEPSIPIETNPHKDMRANIPTGELRDFGIEDENHPTPPCFIRAILKQIS